LQISGNAQTLGEYWVGIESQPVMPALRVHLNLPENQGLVVSKVWPESPAAKAGIEETDILMSAGDVKLTSAQELAKVVISAKETPIKLEIIHAGKPKTIEVTPAKSPQDILIRKSKAPDDMDQIEQWFHGGVGGGAMGGGFGPGRSFSFRTIGPPAILPPDAPNQPQLPGNMSISVSRNGDKPANIVVNWNDKEWKITEKELDKLPPEVRPHVERMLHPVQISGPFGTLSAESLDMTMPAPPPGMPGAPGMKMQVQPFRTMEQQMKEMNRKIEEMQKMMYEHQKRLRQPAPVEKEELEEEEK
jgi:membrane-associated protease RseP (regulator of RpoE activity)